jgi:DNA-directed RNA polymerase subunit N (RpoN/RPB10)
VSVLNTCFNCARHAWSEPSTHRHTTSTGAFVADWGDLGEAKNTMMSATAAASTIAARIASAAVRLNFMTDETSQRLMPLLCFQCGMPVNNKQVNYDLMILSNATPAEAFQALDIRRDCCRTMISSAAVDPRLRRRFHERPSFFKVDRASRLQAQAFTLGTDGNTDPLDAAVASSSTVPASFPSM